MKSENDTHADGGDFPPQADKRRRVRKWGVRIGVLVVLIFGSPLLLWLYADWKWERQIQAELAGYRAAGQPVDLTDFDPPPPPDEDNAALLLKRAADAIKLTQSQWELIDYFDAALGGAKLEEFREIAEANAEVLELVRRARNMKGCDWGIRLRTPAINAAVPALSRQRDLARLLRAMGVYYHKTADDAAAIEALRGALAAGGNQRKSPVLIADLVALHIEGFVYTSVEDIALDLRVSSVVAAGGGAEKAADRQSVQLLIWELLDEAALRKDGVRAYYGERAVMYDSGRLLVDGKTDSGFSRFRSAAFVLLRPLQKRDLLDLLRRMTAYAEAAGQPSWPEAKEKLPARLEIKSYWDSLTRTVSSLFAPAIDRAVLLRFRSIAIRRMAATALAIRLYEIDHGRRPARLGELVPKYLPAVPTDPLAEDGRPIGYLPNAPRPILYSVGENGIDQGGKYADDPDEPPEWEDFDIPFFLNGDRPRDTAEAPGTPRTAAAAKSRPARR